MNLYTYLCKFRYNLKIDDLYDLLSIYLLIVFQVFAQDYEVADIDCSFGEVGIENNRKVNERLRARIRKPEGFKGAPIFADDRRIDPALDPVCQIRPEPSDPNELIYNLQINDLNLIFYYFLNQIN